MLDLLVAAAVEFVIAHDGDLDLAAPIGVAGAVVRPGERDVA